MRQATHGPELTELTMTTHLRNQKETMARISKGVKISLT